MLHPVDKQYTSLSMKRTSLTKLQPTFFVILIFVCMCDAVIEDINSIVTHAKGAFNASSCDYPLLCKERRTRLKVGEAPTSQRSFLGTEIEFNFSMPHPEQHSFENKQQPCRCDPQCTVYGDCCIDSNHLFTSTHETQQRTTVQLPDTVSGHTASCRLLYPDDLYFPRKAVHMVDKCPSSSKDSIANKCHKSVPDNTYRYLLDAPVVSAQTGLVYANWYCALCHNDIEIMEYNHTFICTCKLNSKSELLEMEYINGELAWTTPAKKEDNCSRGVEVQVCVLSISFPESTGRSCEHGRIDTCQDDWPVDADREFCSSYNYRVQDSLGGVYKNPTCARCNNVTQQRLHCLMPIVSLRFGDPRGLDVFLLSDLFSANTPCEKDEAYDHIFEECIKDEYEQSTLSNAASIIFLVFMSLSLIALFLHMVLFFVLFKHRNLHTKNLFTMTCCLFWAELFMVIFPNVCHSEIGCYISTLVVYFCFLSAFFWMNVMSFDVCKTFHTTHIRSNSHRLYIKYAAYAFGSPVVLSLVAVLVNELAPESNVAPGFGVNGFWFSNKGGLLLFFCGPVLVIFIANIAMLGVSIYDIFHHQKAARLATQKPQRNKDGSRERETEAFLKQGTSTTGGEYSKDASQPNQLQTKIKEGLNKVKVNKERVILYSKLALIMGAPWIFALFEDVSTFCLYLFNILNSLQGVFIFIAFDCKAKVIQEVCEKLGWRRMSQTLGTSSATNETSLDAAKSKASSSQQLHGVTSTSH